MNRAARVFILLLLMVAGAGAHPVLQNPVWIDPHPDGVTLYLDVSVRELAVIQRLPVAENGAFDLLEAADYADKHSAYVLDHFRVKADQKFITGSVRGITPPRLPENFKPELEGPDNTHFRYLIHYPLSSPPAVLTFIQTMGREFPTAPGVAWDLSYNYRYGSTPATTAKVYGSLREGEALSFNTGFMGVAEAGTLVRESTPVLWAVLWVMFVTAMALGGKLPLFWFQSAALLWMGVWVASASYEGAIPPWLLVLPAGTCAVLAAVDNIHSHDIQIVARRRLVLLLAGCVFFALGLSRDPLNLEFGKGPLAGQKPEPFLPVLMFASALAAGGATYGLKKLAAKRGPRGERFVLQIVSLVVCGAAIWFMLAMFHIVKLPWLAGATALL